MRPYIQRGKSPHEQAYYTLSRIQRCMQTTRGDAVRADYTKSALRRERQRSSKIKRHGEEQQSSIIRSRERPPPQTRGDDKRRDRYFATRNSRLPLNALAFAAASPRQLCIPPPSPAIGLLLSVLGLCISLTCSGEHISDCLSGQGPHTL